MNAKTTYWSAVHLSIGIPLFIIPNYLSTYIKLLHSVEYLLLIHPIPI